MTKREPYVCSYFVDIVRGKVYTFPCLSRARTEYILRELSWAVEEVKRKRCPICGRQFKRYFSLKNHLSNTTCSLVLLDEIFKASSDFKNNGRNGRGY